MIDTALKFIEEILADYLSGLGLGNSVTLGNLATMQESEKGGKVIISLICIHEEGALTNQPYYKEINKQLIRKTPPLYLNLDLMLAFTFKRYDTSLTYMARTLEFFQKNNCFTGDKYPALDGIDQMQFKIKAQETEQMYNIWSILGGSYYPSIL